MITVDIEMIGLEQAIQELNTLSAALDGGELGRVWHEGAFGPYGQRYESYVQKEGEQAEVHQGYWHTDQDVADQRDSDIQKIFEQLVGSIAAGRRVDVRTASSEALKLIYEDLKTYAPPRAGSSYVRTGTLGAGWRWAVT